MEAEALYEHLDESSLTNFCLLVEQFDTFL